MTVALAIDGGITQIDRPHSSLFFDPASRERRLAGTRRAPSEIDARHIADEPRNAQAVVGRHIDRQTAIDTLPRSIACFLEDQWRSVLTRLYIVEGEASQPWDDAVATTADLAWSVLPKTNDEERRRLFSLLPDLLQRLHEGLATLGLDTDAEDAFFADLAKLHVAALHPAPDGNVPERRAAGHKPSAHADGPEQSDSQPDTDIPGGSSMSEVQEPLQKLGIGDFVELRGKGTSTRVLRLTWVSGQRGVFFFRDQHADDTLALTASRLLQHLSEGSASVLSGTVGRLAGSAAH